MVRKHLGVLNGSAEFMEEYPIGLDGEGIRSVWTDTEDAAPSFAQYKERFGRAPDAIFDIGVTYKGMLVAGFEVERHNPVSKEKLFVISECVSANADFVPEFTLLAIGADAVTQIDYLGLLPHCRKWIIL
jgi:hypothetical protein